MKRRAVAITMLAVLLLPFMSLSAGEIEEDQGVYEYVLTKISGDQQTNLAQLKKAFSQAGWQVLATDVHRSPSGCNYKAIVVSVYDSAYGAQLLGYNAQTAPFALVDRVNLFEDENGLNVSIVNPVNVLRTVLMDDEKYTAFADAHRQKLREIIASALKGTVSRKQYGEIRDEGYIGRTMGVMAGGAFAEKIETVARFNEANIDAVVNNIKTALQNNKGEWGIVARYVLKVPGRSLAVIGLSSPKIESRSYEIVKEGGDDSREDFRCPGIAHAGAYPFELVITGTGKQLQAQMVEAMYRMKMFFEDAGMMAFASNMTMPGSIQDEVEAVVKQAAK